MNEIPGGISTNEQSLIQWLYLLPETVTLKLFDIYIYFMVPILPKCLAFQIIVIFKKIKMN